MPSEFELPPSSHDYLKKLYQSVFFPIRVGQSINIVTFSGAGKWANLNFLSDFIKEIDPTYPNIAYLFLDARNLAYSTTEELQHGLNFMLARATAQHNQSVQDFVKKDADTHSLPLFTHSLLTLVNNYAQRLVIFVDHAELLTEQNRYSKIAVSALTTIEQMHAAKLSFVFITKGEISPSEEVLGKLTKYFMQHPIYEADIPYDKECVIAYITRFSRTRSIPFSPTATKNISYLTLGIPTLTKYLAQEYTTTEAIKQLLDGENTPIDELYEGPQGEFFNHCFEKILLHISPSSKDFLYHISPDVPIYLVKSGLVSNEKRIVNPLFEYFLENRSNRYQLTNGLEGLSPQEKDVLKLLTDTLGTTVTREQIAQVLWPNNWQVKYSEQSIDKVISNLRSKLLKSPYEITVVKGTGIRADRRIG